MVTAMTMPSRFAMMLMSQSDSEDHESVAMPSLNDSVAVPSGAEANAAKASATTCCTMASSFASSMDCGMNG